MIQEHKQILEQEISQKIVILKKEPKTLLKLKQVLESSLQCVKTDAMLKFGTRRFNKLTDENEKKM